MRVRALRECFYKGRRRKGDVFEYNPPPAGAKKKKNSLPPWLEKVPAQTPVKRAKPAEPEKPEPVALGELAEGSKVVGPLEEAPDVEPEFLR